MGKFNPVVTSEPDTPDEPLLTGNHVADKIADTELSTSETAAATGLALFVSRQTSWVSGKPLLPSIERA